VAVRVGERTTVVDQSRLANGHSPEEFAHDDMPGFDGVCSSGLYRLSDGPVHLEAGDAVEVVRSDAEPGTFTTLNYVLFSPNLYLDDLGNDARLAGAALINLKQYDFNPWPEVGMGLVVLPKDAPDAAIEFTMPADGLFLLSVNPNVGASRAKRIPVEVTLPGGARTPLALAGNSPRFGRVGWQPLGALRDAKGATIRVSVGEGGCSCADLVRLEPIDADRIVARDAQPYETFTLQWERPSAEKPWLESVGVVSGSGGPVQAKRLSPPRGLPCGLKVGLPLDKLPVLGATDGSSVCEGSHGSCRVELAGDYGFTLTAELLHSQPFIWLKDLGMFACAEGDFASHRAEMRAMQRAVDQAREQPFVSASEQYYRHTGLDEATRQSDSQMFAFAYDLPRPLAPRAAESIESMPEASYEYFLDRIQNPKDRRSFLGWPNVAEHFYVLSNGLVGVSSLSAAGTGHRRPEDLTVRFGVGAEPEFRACGDPSVTQWMDDGYQLVCNTKWRAGGAEITETALAYPLAGEEVRTGYEPLAAFVRLACDGATPPLWVELTPNSVAGSIDYPLRGLGSARLDGNRLVTGDRNVLACARGRLTLASATDDLVLLRAEPEAGALDVVIPYIPVDSAALSRGVELGFDEARARTKAYWDRRLASGAAVDVPDAVTTSFLKSLYANTLITGELGADGIYALKTSPTIYEAVWLHVTALGVEALARLGHLDEAKQYLDACFHWQGSQAAQEAKDFTTWEGFFNAPPQYTPLLWLNFHGWTQWAAARYFMYSDDRAYLDERLPQLIKSLEWTASQRRITMKTAPDRTRPANYGWLPAARVTDGSAGTSTFSDCANWMGFNELTRLLERMGHPRAAEFRREADDYRACILRGLRVASRRHTPVRLNDGTWVPYVPSYLESTSHIEDPWYDAVVDAGLLGTLDCGVLPDGEPMTRWITANLEDNLFCVAPNLADEPFYIGHAIDYVRRDRPEMAVYTFYSLLSSGVARETGITFETRSWGVARVWDLAPWAMGYTTRLLTGMLCYSEGDGIEYCRAAPKAWLDPGKRIRIEGLQTQFGPTSLVLEAARDRITGTIDVPSRHPLAHASLRLRVNGRVTSIRLNGKPAVFEKETGLVRLPAAGGRVTIEARVRR